MRLLQHIKKDFHLVFLLGISLLFFILKLPSFFEPYWYGDEGIYEVIGFGLRHGRTIYSGIWDNKPPLLYLIYALFNGDQASVRFFSFIIGLTTVFVFYFLTRRLFQKIKISYVLTGVFAALLALPILEGNIANAENFMLLPIISAAFFVFLFAKKLGEPKKLFLPGLLIGIAFLLKIVAVFDFTAFFLALLFVTYTGISGLLKQIRIVIPLILGFILPLFLATLYFLLTGHLITFIQSAFTSNVGYVGYGNQFIIPQGFLLLKLIILGIFCIFLFIKRTKLSLAAQFILLWTAFSVFNMFFSQRPYTHYVLVLLPSLILLFGLAYEESKKNLGKLFFLLAIGILFITVYSFSLFNGLLHKTVAYYVNFISYVGNFKTTANYYAFFDRNTPTDYALSEYINLHKHPNDTIFLWGNNAQVYKLTDMLPPGRFIVAYHITTSQKTMEETRQSLGTIKPKFLLVSLKMSPFPFSLEKYKNTYVIGNFAVYERLF